VSVGVTRLSADVTLPHYHTPGAAGFDLAASVDLTVAPGAVALVPTGLVMALPAGYCLGVFARSSTPLKRGLMVANGVGVVDSDYCGPTDEIKIEVFNFTTAPVQVRAGDRLAQGLILPVARATWVERDRADAPSRGGFGSTG
jgi:dUTP pyrophosphatase